MALEYFPCYHSYRRKIAKLSDQEVGRLFRALLEYAELGETQELTGREAVAFDFIADDIDRAKESYEARCSVNRANGAKGGERPQTPPDGTGGEQMPPKTKTKTKTKTKEKEDTPPTPSLPFSEIQSLFNAACPMLPKCTKLSDARKRALKARLSDGYTLEDFKKLFEKAAQSPFLTGENDRNWTATFDWLITDTNMAKTLDGNYDRKEAKHGIDQDDFAGYQFGTRI